MNYPQSQEILKQIDNSKKILVNLHRGPDPDSFASAFALYYFLCSVGKEVDVVLTKTSELSTQLAGMEEASLVKLVDYAKLDFEKYDLFITPDSGSWQQIVDNREVKLPKIPIIVIDHHDSNEKFGNINLVKSKASSCAQMIYLLFKDWDYFIDTNTAKLLMTGIITDTGGFAFYNDPEVMRVAADLMELGADKVEVINKIFKTKKFEEVKFWGEFLSRLQLDKEHRFIWTAIPKEIYIKYGKPSGMSYVATMFSCIVEDTDFGIVMEEDESKLFISLRSRGKFDVSGLGEQFGGGGHKMAAGGMIEDMPFDKAVKKVLETARKYAKEN